MELVRLNFGIFIFIMPALYLITVMDLGRFLTICHLGSLLCGFGSWLKKPGCLPTLQNSAVAPFISPFLE